MLDRDNSMGFDFPEAIVQKTVDLKPPGIAAKRPGGL
jgi:hypothetical protein